MKYFFEFGFLIFSSFHHNLESFFFCEYKGQLSIQMKIGREDKYVLCLTSLIIK